MTTKLFERWIEYRTALDPIGYYQRQYRARQHDAKYADVLQHLRTRGLIGNFNFALNSYSRPDPTLVLMLDKLQALRTVCRDSNSPQYDQDIITLGNANLLTDVIEGMLELSGFETGDQEAWFERAYNAHDYIRSEDGYFTTTEHCTYCDYDEVYYYDGSFHMVETSGGRMRWHEDVCDNHAFYCEISGKWYSNDDFIQQQTTEGQVICAEYADNHDWYWHEGPEEYSRYPEEEEYDDDDDEEEDEQPRTRIPHYHGGDRSGWAHHMVVANRSTRGFYGIELEVALPSFQAREDFWQQYLYPLGARAHFCGEQDSSIDRTRGIEIVTRPFPLQELQGANPLRELMVRLVEAGGHYTDDNGDSNYGVHVTTNWGRLPQSHKNRVRHLVFAMRQLSMFVAGRKSRSHCNYATEHTSSEGDHHTAVNIRNRHAVEFRIFRSTVEYDRLLSYVEFVDAVVEYTRDESRPIDGPMASSLFRHWFCLVGRYPALAARFPTPSCKDLHPCVLPSSNRPVEFSPKTSSAPASPTILTDADLLHYLTAPSDISIASTSTIFSLPTMQREWIISTV